MTTNMEGIDRRGRGMIDRIIIRGIKEEKY